MSHPGIIPFAFPGLDRVACLFTARPAGDMSFFTDPAAARRRRELLTGLGVPAWAELRQVHGVRIWSEPEAVAPDLLDPAGLAEGDGLAVSRPGLALMVKTADCQPVLLAHREGRFVAALHVGWRGNVQEFPRLAVAELCAVHGVEPGELLAVRGPSLGPAASQFVKFDLEFGERFRPYFDPDSRTVNLWRLTRDQLVQAGLKADNVFGLDLCTWTNAEFFSYRRSKDSGRMASLIWIKP